MDFGSKSAVLEFACIGIGLALLCLFLQSLYSQLCRTYYSFFLTVLRIQMTVTCRL